MPIDQPPSTYTAPISAWNENITVQTLDFHDHGTLATVSREGEVKINWKHVEATIADPASDPQTLNYARLLVAARDGTAEPLLDSTP